MGRRSERDLDLNLKVENADFNGGMKKDGFSKLIDQIERVFFFFIIETSDSKKVKIVVMKLSSQVSAWWNQNKQIREQAGKNPINSQEKLKKEMVDD